MFVSFVVLSLLFAGRAFSYDLDDFEEDEQIFATVCANKMK